MVRMEPLAVDLVCELVVQLDAVDSAGADVATVTQALHHVRRLRGWLDAAEGRLAARADVLAGEGRGAAAADTVGRATKTSTREARRAERRARLLADAPVFADALAHGRISAAHVDALSNATWRLGDVRRSGVLAHADELLALAVSVAPEVFERRCRALVMRLADDGGAADHVELTESSIVTRRIDPVTGMHRIVAEYDPETGARIFTAIDAEVASMIAAAESRAREPGQDVPHAERDGRIADRAHLAATALANLVLGGHRVARPGKTEVVVLIDEASLRHRLHEHGICELADGSPIPVETARRLACEAGILPIVLGGDSVPLDHGRERRLASAEQRRALKSIYATCGFGDCDVPFDRCEVHHVNEWFEHEGRTDLADLIPTCSRHHHAVHEGGWRIQLAADRTLTIHRPDGELHAVCGPDRLPRQLPRRHAA